MSRKKKKDPQPQNKAKMSQISLTVIGKTPKLDCIRYSRKNFTNKNWLSMQSCSFGKC